MKLFNLAIVFTFVLTKTTLSFPIDIEVDDIVERDSFNVSARAREIYDSGYEERSLYDEYELVERRGNKPAAQPAAGSKRPAPPSSAPPAKKPKTTASKPVYEIQCSKYPNVCQNWCYYANCKSKRSDPWTVTVNRKAGLRSQSECKGPNRCSAKTPQTGWPKEPNTNWSCDEQPKNTNDEGGAAAATRCMPATENTSEGTTWKNWINKPGDVKADATQITVKLIGASGGFCAGKSACAKPVESNSPNVATEGPRQR